MRPGRTPSLYEALVDTVIKQRIQLRAALKIEARLVESPGEKKSIDDKTFYSLPKPEKLAAKHPEELRGLGLTRMKARAIHGVAVAAAKGELPDEDEAVKDPWGTAEELTRIWGIGPWTAELAVAQTHPYLPVGPRADLAVRRGLEKILGEPAGHTVEEIIEKLGIHAGLAMYLAALDYELSKKQAQRTSQKQGGRHKH